MLEIQCAAKSKQDFSLKVSGENRDLTLMRQIIFTILFMSCFHFIKWKKYMHSTVDPA